VARTSSSLHITNGDADAKKVGQILDEDTLPWRDFLHDGPVRPGLLIEELSSVRARFISSLGYGSYDSILAAFQDRDACFIDALEWREVTCWFEEDLYDQLQLMQVLHYHTDSTTNMPFFLVQHQKFFGLDPAGIRTLHAQRRPVSKEQIKFATEAWCAFVSDTPENLLRIVHKKRTEPIMPIALAALERLLSEYPSSRNGLSATQQQILEIVAQNNLIGPEALFRENNLREQQYAYLANHQFWLQLSRLINIESPVLRVRGRTEFRYSLNDSLPKEEFTEQQIDLTHLGHQLLANRADFIRESGIDRWIGGVHLTAQNDWRWDRSALQLRRRDS
jgi:hypothetical protein